MGSKTKLMENPYKKDSFRYCVNFHNTALAKDANGVWMGITESLDPGFHYYQIIVDGLGVADPGSESFFGVSDNRSGIEIPEKGVDFYDAKEDPDTVNTALMAMTLRVEEAKAALEQLHELSKDWPFDADLEVQNLIAEAEKLISGEEQE
jgi:hypothetical protein